MVSRAFRAVLGRPVVSRLVSDANPVTARRDGYRFNLVRQLGSAGHGHPSGRHIQICFNDVVEGIEVRSGRRRLLQHQRYRYEVNASGADHDAMTLNGDAPLIFGFVPGVAVEDTFRSMGSPKDEGQMIGIRLESMTDRFTSSHDPGPYLMPGH